jgi:hypothetical protein
VAIANLTMSFSTHQLLGLIYKAQTTAWPGGLAHLVLVKALKKKYQPVDMVSMVEMRQAMSGVSMKKDKDPSSLFEQISGIDNRFQRPSLSMSDEEKISVILMAALKEYVTLLTSEQRQKGPSLTLDDLQGAMLAQWRHTHNSAEQTEGSEIGLAAFQGICDNCQKTGHRANKYPQEKNSNSQGRGGRGRGGGRGQGRERG